MGNTLESKAVLGALTTVNAPPLFYINAGTLLPSLHLRVTKPQWLQHVRAVFSEVDVVVLMDMIIEGPTAFDDLSNSIPF